MVWWCEVPTISEFVFALPPIWMGKWCVVTSVCEPNTICAHICLHHACSLLCTWFYSCTWLCIFTTFNDWWCVRALWHVDCLWTPFGNGPCLCCAISWLMWHGMVILWLPDGFILTCASLSKGILCIVHECAGTCTIMPHVIRPTCIVCYSCYGVVGPFLFGCAWVTQEDIFTHCFLFVQWHWRAHMLFMYLYASDADWRAHMFFTWMCVCIMIVCFSGCACCVGVWHMSWMAR